MLGYKPQELLSEVCFEFFHPDDLEHMVESYQQGLLLKLSLLFFTLCSLMFYLSWETQIQIHTREPKLTKWILSLIKEWYSSPTCLEGLEALTTFVTSGGQVPSATLQLASNPTPAGWNHPSGQQYPQPHAPFPTKG